MPSYAFAETQVIIYQFVVLFVLFLVVVVVVVVLVMVVVRTVVIRVVSYFIRKVSEAALNGGPPG